MSGNRQRQYRSAAVALMVLAACGVMYVFHAHLRISTVFPHLFYVPIVLSSLWWGWKGVITAAVLAGLLFVSSLVFRGGEAVGEDLLRAVVFVAVSVVVAVLSEGIASKQRSLRRLASQLSHAEESQRRRIATDLHDRIGQNLALSKIRVGELRSRPGQAGQPTAGALDEVMALLDEAILDARELTFELCPPMLYELGLAPALEWLAERTRESHGLAVEFHEDDQPKPLDEDVQALLFRGAQELLVNVVKHARADRARVELRREGDQVILTVTDDGVGMDPAKAVGVPADDGGFGLFSLRERLGYIGGRMEIASSGAGSRVTLVAPLARRPGPSAAAGQTSGDSA